MVESELWAKAQEKAAGRRQRVARAVQAHTRALAFLILMYGVWNLVAGTYGFFFPYILEAVGSTSDRATYALQAIWFVSTAIAVGTLYMPLIDRVGRRRLLMWAACCRCWRSCRSSSSRDLRDRAHQRAAVRRGRRHRPAVAVPAVERRAVPDAAALDRPGLHVRRRADRARRLVLLLPTVQQAGFRTLSIVLAALLIVSGAIGIAFAPDTRGRDLEETETAEVHAQRRSRERQAA